MVNSGRVMACMRLVVVVVVAVASSVGTTVVVDDVVVVATEISNVDNDFDDDAVAIVDVIKSNELRAAAELRWLYDCGKASGNTTARRDHAKAIAELRHKDTAAVARFASTKQIC